MNQLLAYGIVGRSGYEATECRVLADKLEVALLAGKVDRIIGYGASKRSFRNAARDLRDQGLAVVPDDLYKEE